MRRTDQRPRVEDETFVVSLSSGFTFAFNVSYALREIIKDRAPSAIVSVDTFLGEAARVSKKHMKSTRVRREDPVILGTLPAPFNIFPMDGHHRAAWRKNMGQTTMVAHLLTEEETYACCYTRSQILAVKRIVRDYESILRNVHELGANVSVIRQP